MDIDGKVMRVIFRAIDDVNQQLPGERRLEKSPETMLLGSEGLDSLGLVSFIVATEQRLEEEFGSPVSLFNEDELSPEGNAFRTIGTLTEYVVTLLP